MVAAVDGLVDVDRLTGGRVARWDLVCPLEARADWADHGLCDVSQADDDSPLLPPSPADDGGRAGARTFAGFEDPDFSAACCLSELHEGVHHHILV